MYKQGALSFETLSGTNTTEFYWRQGFLHFSSGLNEDEETSNAVPLTHGADCRIDAITTLNLSSNRRKIQLVESKIVPAVLLPHAVFWHFHNLTSVYLASEGKALLELFCH